jgi:hypothetical protein
MAYSYITNWPVVLTLTSRLRLYSYYVTSLFNFGSHTQFATTNKLFIFTNTQRSLTVFAVAAAANISPFWFAHREK